MTAKENFKGERKTDVEPFQRKLYSTKLHFFSDFTVSLLTFFLGLEKIFRTENICLDNR